MTDCLLWLSLLPTAALLFLRREWCNIMVGLAAIACLLGLCAVAALTVAWAYSL